MKTINLEFESNKTRQVAELLDGLGHFGANPLASYHAAKSVTNGRLRVGVERQLRAIKKAVSAFNVMVSIATNARGFSAVRLYSPIKQIEIIL